MSTMPGTEKPTLTIVTATGRLAEVRKSLVESVGLDNIAGLDEDGRVVVDNFGARANPADGSFLFGLTLCCQASDKGAEDGVVCRGCYGDEETGADVGNYLFARNGTFPGLDPAVSFIG